MWWLVPEESRLKVFIRVDHLCSEKLRKCLEGNFGFDLLFEPEPLKQVNIAKMKRVHPLANTLGLET